MATVAGLPVSIDSLAVVAEETLVESQDSTVVYQVVLYCPTDGDSFYAIEREGFTLWRFGGTAAGMAKALDEFERLVS